MDKTSGSLHVHSVYQWKIELVARTELGERELRKKDKPSRRRKKGELGTFFRPFIKVFLVDIYLDMGLLCLHGSCMHGTFARFHSGF